MRTKPSSSSNLPKKVKKEPVQIQETNDETVDDTTSMATLNRRQEQKVISLIEQKAKTYKLIKLVLARLSARQKKVRDITKAVRIRQRQLKEDLLDCSKKLPVGTTVELPDDLGVFKAVLRNKYETRTVVVATQNETEEEEKEKEPLIDAAVDQPETTQQNQEGEVTTETNEEENSLLFVAPPPQQQQQQQKEENDPEEGKEKEPLPEVTEEIRVLVERYRSFQIRGPKGGDNPIDEIPEKKLLGYAASFI